MGYLFHLSLKFYDKRFIIRGLKNLVTLIEF